MTDEELKYLRALKPEIDKRMGPLFPGDYYYVDGEGIILNMQEHAAAPEEIMIPHPMPMPGVPIERTLWGMVDWRFYYLDDEGDNWSIRITGDDFVTIGRPYLALLKVLAYQWKIEVKG